MIGADGPAPQADVGVGHLSEGRHIARASDESIENATAPRTPTSDLRSEAHLGDDGEWQDPGCLLEERLPPGLRSESRSPSQALAIIVSTTTAVAIAQASSRIPKNSSSSSGVRSSMANRRRSPIGSTLRRTSATVVGRFGPGVARSSGIRHGPPVCCSDDPRYRFGYLGRPGRPGQQVCGKGASSGAPQRRRWGRE